MNFYASRHKNLMQTLNDGLIFIAATPEVIRNGDVTHAYRQSSNFLYLTGITHADYALLLDPKSKKSHLFIPDITDYHRIWNGRQLDAKQAKKKYVVNFVHYNKDAKKIFAKLGRRYKQIYTDKDGISALKKFDVAKKTNIKKFDAILNQARLIKDAHEIKLMQRANDIAKLGHTAAMKAVKPGLYEYQVQAEMQREFLKHGAKFCAYGSIVATGVNGAILHYHDNDALVKPGELMLIDAACEWDGYAADITRAFPVSGKFNKKQSEIYDIVLKTQNTCINMLKPGVDFYDVHRQSARSIIEGLSELGFFKISDINELLKNDVHRIFYPHGIGHLLGLDVHDVGAPKRRVKVKHLRAAIVLQANMAVTIEPGIYFIEAYFNSAKVRDKYKKWINWKVADSYKDVGGIRIEDDIVVTAKGHLNLTTVPKERKEIEKLMA